MSQGNENKVEKSIFQTLNEYDISKDIKNKSGIKYLPWSKAWTILKTLYPNSEVQVHECESDYEGDNRRYFTDGKTVWVTVTVTIDGHSETESLAVMDYRNKSIPIDQVTSTDVEKSIKRCIVKCIALHGLGLSLWVGEEFSEAALDKKDQSLSEIKKEIMKTIQEKLSGGIAKDKIYDIIESNTGNKNPNAIKDVKLAQKVLAQISSMEVVKNA